MGLVHVLGSGSAKPSAMRSNSSYLIESDTSLSYIDCSGSPAHQALRRGLDLDDLRHVYLTHGHVDHVYGFPSLIHSLWMMGLFRDEPLTVHGPEEAIQVARALLAAFGLEDRRNAVRLDWRPVSARVPTEFDGDAGPFVAGFPVTHANTEAVGYRVLNTVFSGDAICDDRLSTAVDDSVRSLVVDCGGGLVGTAGHAGAEGIAGLVQKRPRLEAVLLTHIGFPPQEEAAVLEQFRDCGADVRILSDGDRFDLA